MSEKNSTNWNTITPSSFPWEKEAIDYIQLQFPTHEPYRAWSNFEFIADDGSINEIDLLVFTPQGFFLVEIKSNPGILSGDTHTWTWQHNGHKKVADNPLFLANLKAKKLASLLQRQRTFAKMRVPFIDPLIFCSAENLESRLGGNARFHVCLRDQDKQAGIVAALKRRECPGLSEQARGTFDRPTAKAVNRALEQIGIKPSQSSRRVGDYELQEILDEGPGYQDFLGKHVSLKDTLRRIRIYLVQAETSPEQRQIVQRAAEREFRLLQTLEHRGVLRALEFTKHELGPAIIFQHFPTAMRLDHYLVEHKDQITDDLRLHLMRQIAETVSFAHGKHVVHRNLSPNAILVVHPDTNNPQTVLMNWQLGNRQAITGGTMLTQQVTATIHVDKLAEESTKVFMAPETFVDLDTPSEYHDIFSLGAICYLLFTGQAPAESPLALAQKLREHRGLRVSAVLNGAPESLDLLVQYSTDPDVSNRLDTADEILDYLNEVENDLTTPSNQVIGDPTQAKAKDMLPGGYTVLRKLGTGSTATALLVEKANQQFVVKIAVDTDHNDRIREEGEVLQKLDSPLIVRCYGTVTIGDRTAILLEPAGDKTLRKRLSEEGRLSLDLLERFGQDLLEAVVVLERTGIAHRDIKPENIGVSAVGRGDALHLVLFDFSLSRCSPENIRAGTPGYLDPFLPLRKPLRWDLQAERYSAAVTIYQMTTGFLPVWYDGKTDPAMVDCEVTIDTERFDPNLRDAFSDFFRRALRRNPRERFDNAQQMLDAWQRIFSTVTLTHSTLTDEGEPDNSALLAVATLDTNIAELGLGPAAVDALDRINVIKVSELLHVWGRRLARMRGVGNKTRKHILAAVKVLRERLGATTSTDHTSTDTADEVEAYESQIPKDQLSIDVMVQRILRAKAKSRNATETTAMEALMGLDQRVDSVWPSQGDIAPLVGVTRGRVSQILADAQKRWLKDPAMTALRDQIAVLLEANGGVMSSQELCDTLLSVRGSVEDDPRRGRLARVVTRAAVETENTLEVPKFILRRVGSNALIATDISLADYAAALGQQADEIATKDPLLPPNRAIEILRAVPLPPESDELNDSRLVRLATAASQNAAISSKQEIYPRNMTAQRAIRLSHGGLVGVRTLTPEQIRQRVSSRYPQAATLPGRPALDHLLADAGLQLAWGTNDQGKEAYVSTSRNPLSITDASSTLQRYSTQQRTSGNATPLPQFQPAYISTDIAEARRFEERLRYAEKNGSFLAMTVKPNLYDQARQELTTRFSTRSFDMERVFLDALRHAADEVGADWSVVEKADSSDDRSEDWRNLNQLIASKAIPKIEAALEKDNVNGQTVLTYHLNWLARYDQVVMLSRVAQAVQDNRIYGVWLLIPASEQTPMPLLDGAAVPVITPNQWANIPESWCQNLHRTKQATSNNISSSAT
ncbi:MAG TPA: BREX system serine/threonine kinase PglW [Phycisphaerales bacterium]|nr:BREX system serine/threonine kinase PglW [Phycisphaerales bacterium]|tara:strand:- start:48221 stop:52492 length:4272 start_codon:yes stop_codon:yes gene_type:complete